VRSAAADLERAEAVLAAGMSTDADVLSIRVHLAAMTEQRIDRTADVDVAKAALNDALGLPLDTPHTLTTPLEALVLPDLALDGLESAASTGRPEARQTHLATSLAQTQADGARSAMLPQVGFRGAFEADRQRFVVRGGANWLAAISLRWNLFNGSADKARIAETGHLVKRAEFDEQRTDSAIRLQVRRAYAGLKAAQQRIQVATAPGTKLVPLMVRVKRGPPAMPELGFKLAIVGGGGMMVNGNPAVVPPPSVTVTLAVPAVVIRPDGTVAVSWPPFP